MRTVLFIVLIVLAIFLLPGVSSYTLLNFVESSCYADGSFTFTVKNDKPDPITLKDVKISVRHAYLDIAPPVTGAWTKQVIYENSTDPDGLKKQASFHSSAGLLNEEGDYVATLNYYDCRDAPHCRMSFRLDNCPEYDERCEEDKVTITKCEQTDSSVSIWFHGPKEVYEAVRPEFDVFYYLDMGNGDIRKLPRLTTPIDFEELGLNKFKVNLPLASGEQVRRASVVKKVCDAPRHQLPEMECTVQEEPVLTPPTKSTPYSLIDEQPEEVTTIEPIVQDAPVPLSPEPVPVQQPPAQQPTQLVEQVQLPTQQALQPEQEALPVVTQQPAPSETPIVVVDRPDLEAPKRIPYHFYFLVSVVILGIIMLIASNRRSRKQGRQQRGMS